MTIPGFTAEASIRKLTRPHRLVSGNEPCREMVVPQQNVNCFSTAFPIPPIWLCWDHCTDMNGLLETSGTYVCGFAAIAFASWGWPSPSGQHYHIF